MTIDSMPITNSKKIPPFFHKILDSEIGILVCFVLFIGTEAATIAKGELRYNIFIFFMLAIFGENFPPLLWARF